MARSIQILTVVILSITSLIIFLIIWACMILLESGAVKSFFVALMCTGLVILTSWSFLSSIDPVCLESKLQDNSEMFTNTNSEKKYNSFLQWLSYYFGFHIRIEPRVESYVSAVDTIYTNYKEGSTADDVFLTEQPKLVDDDDFDYQLIASDEKLEAQAEQNVKNQIDAQPNIINSQGFKEQVYEKLLDNYLDTVKLKPEDTIGKSDDKIKTLKIQKLGLSMRDLHEKLIMVEHKYSYDDMQTFYNERYIAFLRNDSGDSTGFNLVLDVPKITQEQEEQLASIGTNTNESYLETTDRRILYLEKLRGIDKSTSSSYKEQMRSEVIKNRLKDMIDVNSGKEFDLKRQELVENEMDNLKDIRLRSAITYNSQGLLENEYSNPYTILPKDQWFRPDKGAQDIINGKPCNCPMEVRNDKLNYFPVKGQ